MKALGKLFAISMLMAGCAGNHGGEIDSLIRIGQKARLSGNPEVALKCYTKALTLDSDNTTALLGMAEAYIDLKILDAASEYIKKAVEKGGDSAKASYLRGKINLLAGEEELAEKEFLKWTSVDTQNALGAIYDGRGEHERAQNLYKQVIVKDPNYIDAYNNMGLSLMLCNKYDEAIFYLENACALPNATVANRSNLALCYGLSGNMAKARTIYAQDFAEAALEEKMAYIEDITSPKSS
ncbi:MAG: tetratricopeptide repeat protein [Holosporaceae bacterium]|jgi:Flp pilus assembly protein TadD|nr:tetratricopeptide repeat protein [Holosporaceae bacterium]